MKKIGKLFGIITAFALIMCLIVGCDFPTNDNDTNGTGGNGGGGGSIDRKITIKNDTSIDLGYLWIKPSSSTSWGSAILSGWYYETITSGQSQQITLPQSLLEYINFDIQLSTSSGATSTSGSRFLRYNVPLSNGTTVSFTNSNLDNKSNLPQITIKNRSGVSLSNIQLKPSSATDWGISFGSVSNNSSQTITIPMPLTNFSVFDIQMTSTDSIGSGTYSKSNVSISNGMTIIIYSTDRNTSNLYPVIIIQNDTSINLGYLWIKPSSSTSWGSAILSGWYYETISTGDSYAIRLSDTLSTNSVYDFQLSTNSGATSTTGSRFFRNNVTITDGFTITFTNSNLQ
ncbi:MAG: hypothetical protein FWC12_10925 [Treponema sp.]|nr:hypothetical protein [Treponema sp.]